MITTLRKVRRLPSQGRISVPVGQAVAADTVVGVLDYIPGQLYRLNIAAALGVPPAQINEVLIKQVGDWVAVGETIAVSDEFYVRRVATSSRAGAIALISWALGQVFIRTQLPTTTGEPVTVSATEAGIGLLAFNASLRVGVGQRVEQDQLLATNGSTLDLMVQYGSAVRGKRVELRAPIFGRVTGISRTAGTITITPPLRQVTEMLAHIPGQVTALSPGEWVEVSARGHLIQGVIGFGGEATGELVVPTAGAERDLVVADLPADLSGRIIVGRRAADSEVLQQCAAGGAAGIVLGSADRAALQQLLGADPVQAIGASAETALTVILINGFGDLPMPAETYAELAGLQGRVASLDGATQLRAGVVRPEVFVPLALGAEAETATVAGARAGTDTGQITVGARVMIVRDPGFGRVGTVVAVAATPQRLPSGAVTITATVASERGDAPLTVPLANLKRVGEVSA